MKTILKSSKAKLIAFLAIIVCIVTAISLTACNNTPSEEQDAVITKYDATLNAGITMIPTEPSVSFGGLLADTYVTKDNGAYTLTLIFQVCEIEVLPNVGGEVFIDNNPTNPDTVQGVKDGTIGAYNLNGQLVTDGVKVTYSSGDDYKLNKDSANVYYVKSAALPVDSLRESYSITFYANSAIMGKQFSNDTYSATVKLDLASGEVVEEISGLGVDTLGEVSPYSSYGATLDASINMGQPVSFGDVLKSAYITAENGELTLTLIFAVADIEIRGIPATIFVDDNPASASASADDIADGTIGIYNSDDELITDGVKLTYGKGYAPTADGYKSYVQSAEFPIESISESYTIALYVNSNSRMGGIEFVDAKVNLDIESGEVVDSISGLGSEKALDAPDVVNSMSFTVIGDTLEQTYNLAVYVTAFNTTATSGMQFPYESAKLGTTDAVLTIIEDDGNYTATLDAVVSMGGSNVNFTENLIKGIEIEVVEGGFKVTVLFGYGTVNMPYNNVMTGYMNAASNTDYFNNVVEPVYGYYDGDTLVTEGVELN